jgi:SAM-dependent methyltransferase
MSERREGVWRLLANPIFYEAVQHLVGARRWLRRFAQETIRARPGDRVLDVGCGTGVLLRYLPNVTYMGIDANAGCIAQAHKEHGDRGRFVCADLCNFDVRDFGTADIVVAIGLLHHLDDTLAADILNSVAKTLRPGGRLITADPCFHPSQSALMRFVISKDRGLHVRDFSRYAELLQSAFPQPSATLTMGHLPFPHSVCAMEATRP